jgi:hypothetical protein
MTDPRLLLPPVPIPEPVTLVPDALRRPTMIDMSIHVGVDFRSWLPSSDRPRSASMWI